MKLLRIVTLALLVTTPALLMGAGCPHPVPNPGQVILTCAMDAVHNPEVVNAVMNALVQPDWASRLAALINPAIGVTTEVIACILHSFLGKASAEPDHPERYQRARLYLKDHGYQVP